jgi:hypothetical protein
MNSFTSLMRLAGRGLFTRFDDEQLLWLLSSAAANLPRHLGARPSEILEIDPMVTSENSSSYRPLGETALDPTSPYNLRSVHRKNGGREHATVGALSGEYVVWLPDADRRNTHCSGIDDPWLFDDQEVDVVCSGANTCRSSGTCSLLCSTRATAVNEGHKLQEGAEKTDVKSVPQGLKPIVVSSFTARLKSCPNAKHENYDSGELAPSADLTQD